MEAKPAMEGGPAVGQLASEHEGGAQPASLFRCAVPSYPECPSALHLLRLGQQWADCLFTSLFFENQVSR